MYKVERNAPYRGRKHRGELFHVPLGVALARYMKALYQQMWDAAAVDGAGITRQEVSAIAEKNMFFYHAVLKNFLKKPLTE